MSEHWVRKSIDDLVVGNVGEWDLLSGDLIEHTAQDHAVYRIAVSGDMIATGGRAFIRVFNISTCLLM